nr:exodeoxyribonuclease I [uncultured Holophaga sp.]
MTSTFYWHDYETFGVDPRVDRPAQFAGLRTDLDLNPVGEPLELFCRLAPDYLPNPEACLLTGIWPAQVQAEGVCEADFIGQVHAELSRPGTCTVGYNSLRFDDELTRATLFRNLLDPYAREYAHGNSRWDLIDVLRTARALRPDGLEWPVDAEGQPSFRLERLTEANDIPHAGAHTALADVRATVALARKLKSAQPRLWDYALHCRSKQWVIQQLDPGHPQAILHVSSQFKATLGCLSLVWPLGTHPTRANEVLAWDLRQSPEPFLELHQDQLRERLFTSGPELAARGWERLPVKAIHANRCPMVMRDLRLLTPALAERYELRIDEALKRGENLQQQPAFLERVRAAYFSGGPGTCGDPDFSLYGGPFLSDQDRRLLGRMHRTAPGELGALQLPFQDPRLPELFFRYRARNWPQSLCPAERERWEAHCRSRRECPPHPKLLSRQQFQILLEELKAAHPEAGEKLQALEVWVDSASHAQPLRS